MKKGIEMKKRTIRRKGRTLFSTGSTLLNLACSDSYYGAFLPGTMVNVVGDSSAGKSLLGLSVLAEAANNPAFDEYLLVLDDVESALFFDIRKLFGVKAEERIQGPDGPVSSSRSDTIEEFYFKVDTLIKNGVPFIYILDSMDALTSESEQDKFEERKDAFQKGKKTTGSFGDGKAKVNSQNLRHVVNKLEKTGSLLIIISQTRDNIGISFAPKTRSGGRALTFYAVHEMWLAVVEKLKKTVRKKNRTIGSKIRVRVTKNKETGRQGEINFYIYFSYGVDDIGSCIDFLIEEGEWKKKGRYISTDLFPDVNTSRDDLIRFIEEDPEALVSLQKKCESVWKEILEACSLQRKSKYE